MGRTPTICRRGFAIDTGNPANTCTSSFFGIGLPERPDPCTAGLRISLIDQSGRAATAPVAF
jgi:hypothetical protein